MHLKHLTGLVVGSLVLSVAAAASPASADLATSQTTGPASSLAATKVQREHGRITRVVDGDTVDVRLSAGRLVRVRLLGIDTPEVYSGIECGGPEASKAAKQMLPTGTKVRLTSDPTQALKDRYERLLRYVSRGRTDVNRKLVRRGWAEVYVCNNKPFQRTRSYTRDQTRAKNNDLGLWGLCGSGTPPPPPPPGSDLNSYPPSSTYTCPPNAPIKGNEGSWIFHPPSSPWYSITTPEQCFASEAGAVAHGFRRAIY